MNLTKSLKSIYRPKYIIFNIAAAIAYYYLISYLLSVQQQGIPITSVPLYLIYLLSAVSSVSLTIGVYSIRNTIRNMASASATTIGTASALIGGVLAGCGCQAAILFSVATVFFGIGEARLINTVATENANYIFAALIIINLFVIAYYLNKLSQPGCRPKRAKRK